MKLPWILAIIALVLAGYLGVRAHRAEERAERAEGVLANQERLANLAEGFQPATLVRVTETTLTYRIPIQVTVEGQVFVNGTDVTATFGPALEIFGPRIQEDGIGTLMKLPEGTPISVRTTDGSQGTVEAVYVP